MDHIKSKEDKLHEAYYAFVGEGHIDNVSCEIDEHLDFTELDTWFNSYEKQHLKEQKKMMFKKTIIKYSKVAAISLLAVTIGFTALFTGVEAFRVKVLNTVVNKNPSHISIVTVDYDQQRALGALLPDDLPENYKLFSYEQLGTMHLSKFQDDHGGFLNIAQSPIGAAVQMDSEGSIVKELDIDDNYLIYAVKDDFITAYYEDKHRAFTISTTLSEELFIKMIKSLK